MKQDTTLTRVTVSADPRTELSPADRLLRTLQSSLAGQFELFGELGRGEGGRIVYLAREQTSGRLVALQLTPTGTKTVGGEDYWFEIVRTLDASVPAVDSNCPRCGKSLGGWGRFCRHCGADLGGIVPADKPGAADELLRDVRAVARGRYDVLGQMDRTEGGGTVYFARELATGKLVALRLQREGAGVHGTERYNIGVTGVLRPALAAALGVGAAPPKAAPVPTAAQVAATVVAPPPLPPVPQLAVPVTPEPPAPVVTPPTVEPTQAPWRPNRDQWIAIGATAVTALALIWFAVSRAGADDDLLMGDPSVVDTTAPIASTMMAVDSGDVQIDVQLPRGARVLVNGAAASGKMLRLPAGTHTLSLTAPGYRDATQEVTVRTQQTLVWTPQLVRVSSSGGAVASPKSRPPEPRRPAPARPTPSPTTRPASPTARSTTNAYGDSAQPASVAANRRDTTPLTDLTAVSCGSLFARLEWPRARVVCEEEARRGSVTAQRTVGTIHERGLGVNPNAAVAFQWYAKAAEGGDAIAQYRAGLLLFEGRGVSRDQAQAVTWFRRAADQQQLDAMYMVGQALERGQGVRKNASEALAVFTRVAELGYPRGQTKMGSLFEAGDIVTKDDRAAVAWFRKAAEQQYAEAQYRLGEMYARGKGVARSDAEAKRWFSLAAAQGHERARKALR